MIYALFEVLAAYLFVDLLTGIYHYVTDQGWNFSQQIRLFQDHHQTNSMGPDFDWQPAVVGLPVMLLGLWLESSFLIAGGAFGILGQVPHWYAHHRSRSRYVHLLVKRLQRWGVILSPTAHAEHHNGVFDRNFCILSGWNNRWLNKVFHLFARL